MRVLGLDLWWREVQRSLQLQYLAVMLHVGQAACCCAGELEQKEGAQVASRAEFAKRVALDLFRFMESFNVSAAGDQLVVPANIIERWHTK